MDMNYYKKYEPIFGSWYIKKKLGEGSFGKVYEIERNELGVTYKAALKTITIPQSQSEIKSIMADGMNYKDVTAYYEGVVGEIISEFQLMSQLKGNSNIVSYEDHQLIKHEDGIGWDILIRMELLTPIFDYMEHNRMTKRDVIKMGIDLCKSLELCQKHNIIHRDVKPENVFVSSLGDFKLGDFGIARTAEKTMSGMSRKGTFLYMAPEVYLGKAYNSTVDIYSLGLVMYRMLNDNRAPFFPAYPNPITYSDRENALIKRMSGNDIPAPVNAEGRLSEIILKACSFDPDKRYRSASQMRRDLEEILYSEKEAGVIYPNGDEIRPKSVRYVETANERGETTEKIEDDTVKLEEQEQNETDIFETTKKEETNKANNEVNDTVAEGSSSAKKSVDRKKGLIGIVAAVIVIVAILLIMLLPRGVKDITGIEDGTEIFIGETLSPEYVIESKNSNDDKIKFSVSDDKIISVDNKGKIIAKNVGEAELTMRVGKYKEVVKIIVKSKVEKIENVSSNIEITEGQTETIEPLLKPEKYADCEIEYKIIDKDIATIDSNGTITAQNPGTTKLVIKAGGCELKVKIIVHEYIVQKSTYTPKKKETTTNKQNNEVTPSVNTETPNIESESEADPFESLEIEDESITDDEAGVAPFESLEMEQ